MARDQGDKPEASSSFVASDDNMLVDPPQEHQDVSCAQSFSSRCLFDWFADSGATQHMSDQRQLMINYKPIEPGTWSVSGIGGMTLPVLGVGDVPVITQIDGEEQDFLITGVLHVDKIGVNLFSIGAATAKDMKGFFSGNKCFFYSDKQTYTNRRKGRQDDVLSQYSVSGNTGLCKIRWGSCFNLSLASTFGTC